MPNRITNSWEKYPLKNNTIRDTPCISKNIKRIERIKENNKSSFSTHINKNKYSPGRGTMPHSSRVLFFSFFSRLTFKLLFGMRIKRPSCCRGLLRESYTSRPTRKPFPLNLHVSYFPAASCVSHNAFAKCMSHYELKFAWKFEPFTSTEKLFRNSCRVVSSFFLLCPGHFC